MHLKDKTWHIKPHMYIAPTLGICASFDIFSLYVRKNKMEKDKNYSTFVFIVSSDEELDIRAVVDHDWIGQICCFFSPNDRGRRY